MAQKAKKNKPPKPEDIMKYEIAKELGLLEKVQKYGWGGLTAKETGRIGGLITRRKKQGKSDGTMSDKPSQ